MKYSIYLYSLVLIKIVLLVIAGPPENVVKLRTTTPLFRAYDHAYRLLENTYCPMFLQSDRVSSLLYFMPLFETHIKSVNCIKYKN